MTPQEAAKVYIEDGYTPESVSERVKWVEGGRKGPKPTLRKPMPEGMEPERGRELPQSDPQAALASARSAVNEMPGASPWHALKSMAARGVEGFHQMGVDIGEGAAAMAVGKGGDGTSIPERMAKGAGAFAGGWMVPFLPSGMQKDFRETYDTPGAEQASRLSAAIPVAASGPFAPVVGPAYAGAATLAEGGTLGDAAEVAGAAALLALAGVGVGKAAGKAAGNVADRIKGAETAVGRNIRAIEDTPTAGGEPGKVGVLGAKSKAARQATVDTGREISVGSAQDHPSLTNKAAAAARRFAGGENPSASPLQLVRDVVRDVVGKGNPPAEYAQGPTRQRITRGRGRHQELAKATSERARHLADEFQQAMSEDFGLRKPDARPVPDEQVQHVLNTVREQLEGREIGGVIIGREHLTDLASMEKALESAIAQKPVQGDASFTATRTSGVPSGRGGAEPSTRGLTQQEIAARDARSAGMGKTMQSGSGEGLVRRTDVQVKHGSADAPAFDIQRFSGENSKASTTGLSPAEAESRAAYLKGAESKGLEWSETGGSVILKGPPGEEFTGAYYPPGKPGLVPTVDYTTPGTSTPTQLYPGARPIAVRGEPTTSTIVQGGPSMPRGAQGPETPGRPSKVTVTGPTGKATFDPIEGPRPSYATDTHKLTKLKMLAQKLADIQDTPVRVELGRVADAARAAVEASDERMIPLNAAYAKAASQIGRVNQILANLDATKVEGTAQKQVAASSKMRRYGHPEEVDVNAQVEELARLLPELERDIAILRASSAEEQMKLGGTMVVGTGGRPSLRGAMGAESAEFLEGRVAYPALRGAEKHNPKAAAAAASQTRKKRRIRVE